MRAVVAMSGGVDSSVAAALMVKAGYEVIGVMLRLWNQTNKEDENRCCTPEAVAMARRVAARLGIPFHVLDARLTFYKNIVESFIDEYSQGLTPNPCIRCNQRIRWGFLLDQARAMGADVFVTGHYARVDLQDGHPVLRKGIDPTKDQSYVLAGLSQQQLAFTLLPVGDYTKAQIRQIAAEQNFEVASRPDSQDLCFLGSQDYREFIASFQPDSPGFSPGKIVDLAGNILGDHEGLIHYTIGQRKGIKVSAAQPYYVIRKDYSSNQLVVGQIEHAGIHSFMLDSLNWLGRQAPQEVPGLTAMVRYRSKELPVRSLTPQQAGLWRTELEYSQAGIAPGQLCVFYKGDQVMGSGRILRV